MAEYVIFPRSILQDSLVDLPPAVRMAWIALIFEAHQHAGRVFLAAYALARLAAISTAEATAALRIFKEPDPYAMDQSREGRRIVPVGVDGWYEIVGWDEWRRIRRTYLSRERQKRYREAKRAAG